MKIAVLGGGNGSFAAAGDLALQGHEVRLWRRDTAAVAEHRANGSRILSLPGTEKTVRCYSGVVLLIIDEAARVDDALYRAGRPMLAVSKGRLSAFSTPFGKRGWFHDA